MKRNRRLRVHDDMELFDFSRVRIQRFLYTNTKRLRLGYWGNSQDEYYHTRRSPQQTTQEHRIRRENNHTAQCANQQQTQKRVKVSTSLNNRQRVRATIDWRASEATAAAGCDVTPPPLSHRRVDRALHFQPVSRLLVLS